MLSLLLLLLICKKKKEENGTSLPPFGGFVGRKEDLVTSSLLHSSLPSLQGRHSPNLTVRRVSRIDTGLKPISGRRQQ